MVDECNAQALSSSKERCMTGTVGLPETGGVLGTEEGRGLRLSGSREVHKERC